MSIFQTANGRFRVQLRRKGYPKLDAIYLTQAEAELAQSQALGQVLTTDELTLAKAIEIYKKSSFFTENKPSNKARQLVALRALSPLHPYAISRLISNPSILSDYRDTRRQTVSADTVRIELSALSCVFRVLAERRYINERDNPCAGIYHGGHKFKPIRLSDKDESALYKALLNPKLTYNELESIRYFLILRTTGMRPGELALLPLTAIDLTTRNISLYYAKTGTRHIRITDECLEYVKAQLSSMPPTNSHLFESRSTKPPFNPIPYNYATRLKTLKGRGILSAQFLAHSVRKEYVSREIENGTAFFDIAVQTGHHNVISLEPYRVLAKVMPPAQVQRIEDQAALRRQQSITSMLSKCTKAELEAYLLALDKS